MPTTPESIAKHQEEKLCDDIWYYVREHKDSLSAELRIKQIRRFALFHIEPLKKQLIESQVDLRAAKEKFKAEKRELRATIATLTTQLENCVKEDADQEDDTNTED